MQQSLSKVTERLSIELFIYLLYMRIIMGVAQCNGAVLIIQGLNSCLPNSIHILADMLCLSAP